MYTLAVVGSYLLLLFISYFLDPKRKGGARKYSILHLCVFSTSKMLFVIGFVVTFALLGKNDMPQALGVSGFSSSWHSLVFGVLAAVGFILIYVVWQVVAPRSEMKSEETHSTESRIKGLLPTSWLPLIGVFMIISVQAGVLEEVFFRGIMQSQFEHYVTTPWAVIISAILFGIAHFYQGASGVVGTSVLGIWLGLSFAMTGNILVPVLGHILGDFSCMMLGARSVVRREVGASSI